MEILFFEINACKTWLHRRVRVLPGAVALPPKKAFLAFIGRFFVLKQPPPPIVLIRTVICRVAGVPL